MAEREYRRLTGSRARHSKLFVGYSSHRASLWLGSDHLLQIYSTRYTEAYKRFYFRDIQAVTIQPNGRRRAWNLVLSVLLLIFLVFGVGANPTLSPGVVISLAIAGLLATLLVVNNILGPSCVCYLRTAVQMEELSSLCRVNRARKILERIRPFIRAAQGELTREEIVLGMERLGETQAAAPVSAPPVLPVEPATALGDVQTP